MDGNAAWVRHQCRRIPRRYAGAQGKRRISNSAVGGHGEMKNFNNNTQVIQTLLANPLDLALVKSLTTPDVTYV
jgi:hypothetical protein